MWQPWLTPEMGPENTIENQDNNFLDATDNDLIVEVDDSVERGERKVIGFYSEDAQQIILNVYEGLRKKMCSKDAVNQTVTLTKVSRTTVYKLIKNGPSGKKTRVDCGSSKVIKTHHLGQVRDIIYNMWAERNYPNLRSIQIELKRKEVIDCARTTLWRFLKNNGFKFKTIDKRQSIMESKRLVVWRNEYLETLTKYRECGRPIYYLDETWYDTHATVKKGWADQNQRKCSVDVPSNKGKRISILHCGSSDGWVEGALLLSAKNIKNCFLDYHQDMDSPLFEKWFSETLLPKLKKNSVIVMDNAPYHSRVRVRVPTSSSTKDELKFFLEQNDLYYEECYTKKQLLEVLRTKTFKKEYVIDCLAKQAGHEVLRLPPYYCVLNPIELLWGQLKRNIASKNQSPKLSASVIKLIESEVAAIDNQHWTSCIKHVKQVEVKYLQAFSNVNKLIINVDSSDDDEIDTDIAILE